MAGQEVILMVDDMVVKVYLIADMVLLMVDKVYLMVHDMSNKVF
jgi:hypothetical protein